MLGTGRGDSHYQIKTKGGWLGYTVSTWWVLQGGYLRQTNKNDLALLVSELLRFPLGQQDMNDLIQNFTMYKIYLYLIFNYPRQQWALVNIRWIEFWDHDVRPSKTCITEIDQVK